MRQSVKEYFLAYGRWFVVLLLGPIIGVVGLGLDISGKVTFPAGVWVDAILVAAVAAPLVAFHRVRVERDELKERARVLLGFDGTDEARHGIWGYSLGLVVCNRGREPAEGCVGKLVKIERLEPEYDAGTLRSLPRNHALVWREEGAVRSFGGFSIAGEQRAALEIIRTEGVPYKTTQVSVGYVGTEESSASSWLHTNLGPILIVISVASKGADPVYAVCLFKAELDAKGWYLQLLEPIGEIREEPNLDDYRQMLAANTQVSRNE